MSKPDDLDLDDLFRSSLRIFLSVDIVGSTAFKQAGSNKRTDKTAGNPSAPVALWFSPIAQFYRGIERSFSEQWSKCKSEVSGNGWDAGEDPHLWKSVGDELIYTKLLTDHKQALLTVNAWINAVKSYRKELRSNFPTLDLKSTAWIAGFPIHNAEVVFKSNVTKVQEQEMDDDAVYSNLLLLSEYRKSPNDPNFTRDFIGPAIDTGFRLSQMSSVRRMVISVDLAILLVNAVRVQPPKFHYAPLRFFYDGRHALKGVFGGLEYPLFWVDMQPEGVLEGSEDKLNNKRPLSTDDIKLFCEEFIQSNSNYSFMPYIVGNNDPYFANMPDHHREQMQELKSYFQNETAKRKDETASGLQAANPAESTKIDRKDLADFVLRWTVVPKAGGKPRLEMSTKMGRHPKVRPVVSRKRPPSDES